MNVLLGLSPFIVFFVLMRGVSPTAGLTGALVASALLVLRMRVRRESLKILEVGSLALFGLLTVYTLAARPEWTVATVRLAVDAGLLAIVVISLAIGRPFTIQYAREQVAEQFWATPRFMAVNRAISSVGGRRRGAIGARPSRRSRDARGGAAPRSRLPAASVAAFVGAVAFTRLYPARVRRQVKATFGVDVA